MKWMLMLLAAGTLAAADGPQLFFSKKFPGSQPEYVQITVDKIGAVEYREAVDDELPVKFKLNEADTQTVFDLAGKLEHFKNPLESPLKVAFMGTKTFRYQDGAEKGEVQFNYTADLTGQALLDWFERISESAQHRINLERAVKYDKLGVDQALRTLWSALSRNRLVAREQYLPLLDRVANNETYMHTARSKAAEMAEEIRGAKPH